ncbi:uncharacterized protein BDV14DRAFT_201215 [Aspergillus stella-maris]|uniref:uncharacterized protein n=1 Tax=Aspergillus stella-maris TaxID=1810926 RepID=UPI003CCE53BD
MSADRPFYRLPCLSEFNGMGVDLDDESLLGVKPEGRGDTWVLSGSTSPAPAHFYRNAAPSAHLSLFLQARPKREIKAERAFYKALWPALEGLQFSLESFTFSRPNGTFSDVPYSEILHPGCFPLVGSTSLVSLCVPVALLYGNGCHHVTPRKLGSHIPLTLQKLELSYPSYSDLERICHRSKFDWEMEFAGIVRATVGGKGFGRGSGGREVEWVGTEKGDDAWPLEEMHAIKSTVIGQYSWEKMVDSDDEEEEKGETGDEEEADEEEEDAEEEAENEEEGEEDERKKNAEEQSTSDADDDEDNE